MNFNIKNMEKLISKTSEVIIIDLLEHVIRMPEDPCLNALVEPEQGLYLVGQLDPFISIKNKLFFKSNLEKQILIPNEILNAKEPIVNEFNEVKITPSDIFTKRNYISTSPSIPSVGIKLTCSIATRHLNELCVYTKSNIGSARLDELVKPEYQYLIHTYKYEKELSRLLDKINEFVSSDIWHIYFYKIVGTNLVIEKTVDFRIYDWYRLKNEYENQNTERTEQYEGFRGIESS